MRLRISAVAALIAILVICPSLPTANNPAAGAPVHSGGRALPPLNGTQWDVIENTTLTSDVLFAGNITVYTNAMLTIKGARLVVPPNPSNPWVFYVKAGGTVQVLNDSTLDIDSFQGESGMGIEIRNSEVEAHGVFQAPVGCYVESATITVTGEPALADGQSGGPAKLVLSPPSATKPTGAISNSVLTVIGGDGKNGTVGSGMAGGNGGDATLSIDSKTITNLKAVVRGGRGGTGGSAGGTSVNGGDGGRGGNVAIQITGNDFVQSTITGTAGNGGNGIEGASPPGTHAGNGGRGGNGGAADLKWSGGNIELSSGSNITLKTGNAGRGGAGGTAQTPGKNGGTGGDAGNGGNSIVTINALGTFMVTDSNLNFLAGYGPAGGKYGRSMLNGQDGKAGAGGSGGSVTWAMNIVDGFEANNASLYAQGGNAGTGGSGSIAGSGGAGGTSNITISIASLTVEPTFMFSTGALVSRGGSGGDGGQPQKTATNPGQPGDGGKGGGARLQVVSSNELQSVVFTWVELACDPGALGTAIPPGKPGNPGVGVLELHTKSLLMQNGSVSQTMGPVVGSDYWRLESTSISSNTPFIDISDSGVAEVFYRLIAQVKDINGNLVTNGTATVEVTLNGKPAAIPRRTNSFGRAEFLLPADRFVANPEETLRHLTYIATATDDFGRYSKPQSVQLTEDKVVDLILIEKNFLPVVVIDSPSDKLTPILYASDKLRSDGTTDPLVIEGGAADSVFNSEQSISRIEMRIGDGPWLEVNFSMPTFNNYKWNYSWDIYNWAQSQLTKYPLGIIPSPIQARAWNDKFYSDIAAQNITVYLLNIPPPLPTVAITKPVYSSRDSPNDTKVKYERMYAFDAKVLSSNGTRVIRWSWCFDDTGVNWREDYSSPYTPSTNVSFTKEQNDQYFFVILKVFDNESAKRVDLVRGGVPLSQFGYAFEPDGSVIVRLRVYVEPPPPIVKSIIEIILEKYGFLLAMGIVAIVMMAGAGMTYRVRHKRIEERRRKEEAENLRVDVADLTCARCGEPVTDAKTGCLQCRAQDALSVVQQHILRLKDSGVNITDAEAMLEEGVDAFDSKSYQEAITKANGAREKAAALEAKYADTSVVISGWETKISNIKIETPEADLTEPETKVYHARLALGRGDHAEAIKNLEGLDPLLVKASKAGMRKGVEELIESTKRLMANVQKRGVMLDKKVPSAIDHAAFALQQSEYEMAEEHCREAERMVRETNKSFMKATEGIRQSDERILDAKGTARPLGTTEDLLKQARQGMNTGDYPSVLDLTGKILGFFGVAPRAPAPKRVDWKREVAILETKAGMPAGASPLGQLMASGAAVPAEPGPGAAGAPPVLEMEASPELRDAAERMIKEATDTLARVRELALDVSDGEDLVVKAKDAYKSRRFAESTELAKSAKFLMQELASTTPRAKPKIVAASPATAVPTPVAPPPAAVSEPKASIDRAEALVGQLSSIGADVSPLETLITRAKSARDGGSTIVALQLAKDAVSQGEELQKQYESAKKHMDRADRLLNVAKQRGLDTSDADFQMRQARNAMSGGAFERAGDTATLVVNILNELAPDLEKEEAPKPAAAPPAAVTAAAQPPVPAAAEGPKCPGCGKTVKPHWKSCPFCGARTALAEEKPAAPAPAPSAPAPAAMPAPAAAPVLPEVAAPPPVAAKPVAPAPRPLISAPPAAPPVPTEAPPAPVPVIAPPPAALAPPAPPAAAPAAAPQGPACPKCNAALKPHWKVCPACGASITPTAPVQVQPLPAARPEPAAPEIRCPACGTKVGADATTCPMCNTALASGKEPAPEPVVRKRVLKVVKSIAEAAAMEVPRPTSPAETEAKKPVVKMLKKKVLVVKKDEMPK